MELTAKKKEEIPEAEVEMKNLVITEKSNITLPDHIDMVHGLAQRGKQYAQDLKEIKQQALSLTNESDWSDQSGTPYLEGSGCQKVAFWFGINWKFLTEPQRVDLGDGHYRYDVTMTFWKNDRYIEVVGTRASNDPFFTIYYEYVKGERVQKLRHPREIDSGNVLKAAITNGMQGILSFIGMKKLTYEDLKAANLNVEKIKKIPYQKKKEAPLQEQPQQKTPVEQKIPEEAVETKYEPLTDLNIRTSKPQDSLTDKQLNALHNILKHSKETLHMVTESLFDIRVDDPALLTFKEASATISYFSDKMNQKKNGGGK